MFLFEYYRKNFFAKHVMNTLQRIAILSFFSLGPRLEHAECVRVMK
mgnify:CR=1 FL=1